MPAMQLPSNWMLVAGPAWLRGGPRWLGFVAVSWGLVASSFAFVQGPTSFLLLRLLLGAAEAGAFPGMWYVISIWYPADRCTFPLAVAESGEGQRRSQCTLLGCCPHAMRGGPILPPS
jgi:MFS family permease